MDQSSNDLLSVVVREGETTLGCHDATTVFGPLTSLVELKMHVVELKPIFPDP